MEISPFTVYLWQQADRFNSFATCIGVIALVLLVISMIACVATRCAAKSNSDDSLLGASESLLKFAATMIVLVFASSLVPTTKTVAMAYAIPKIVQSKAVQQDLPELYDMAIKSLKEQLSPKVEVEKSK